MSQTREELEIALGKLKEINPEEIVEMQLQDENFIQSLSERTGAKPATVELWLAVSEASG